MKVHIGKEKGIGFSIRSHIPDGLLVHIQQIFRFLPSCQIVVQCHQSVLHDEITHPVLRNAAAVRSRIGLDGHIILGFCFRSRNGDKINLDIRIFFFKFLSFPIYL